MIILKERDLYVDCVCDARFVASESDFQINAFNGHAFTQCPNCGEIYYVVAKELETIKPEIKGEKIEDDNQSEMQNDSLSL